MVNNPDERMDAHLISKLGEIFNARVESQKEYFEYQLTHKNNDILFMRDKLISLQYRVSQYLLESRAAEITLLPFFPEQATLRDIEAQRIKAGVDWLARHGEAAIIGWRTTTEFEVTAAIRWSSDTFIRAACYWLLDRDAEEIDIKSYSELLQGGLTRQKLLRKIALSSEASMELRANSMPELGNADFVAAAYERLLGRPADANGLNHYLNQLGRGYGRGDVLLGIARSSEARAVGTPAASALRSVAYTRTFLFQIHCALDRMIPRMNSDRQTWRTTRLIESNANDARNAHDKLQRHLGTYHERITDYVAAAHKRHAVWLEETASAPHG